MAQEVNTVVSEVHEQPLPVLLNHFGSLLPCAPASLCAIPTPLPHSTPPLGKDSCSPLQGQCFGCLLGFSSTFLSASVLLQYFCLSHTICQTHSTSKQQVTSLSTLIHKMYLLNSCSKLWVWGFFPSLPLQFFLVVRIIFTLCFRRATDKEGWFDSGSGCFCMWLSHKWSLLGAEEVSKP